LPLVTDAADQWKERMVFVPFSFVSDAVYLLEYFDEFVIRRRLPSCIGAF
jgi:hypothetical protein